jgi:hypothetical protein
MWTEESIAQRMKEHERKYKLLKAETDKKNERLKVGRKFCHDNKIEIHQLDMLRTPIDFGCLVNPEELLQFKSFNEEFLNDFDIFIFGYCCLSLKDYYSVRTSRGLIGYRIKEFLENFISKCDIRPWFEDNVIGVEVPKELSKKYFINENNEGLRTFRSANALGELLRNNLVNSLLLGNKLNLPQRAINDLLWRFSC